MPPDPAGAGARRQRQLLLGAILFAASLLMRLLFWRATPDRQWPYSVFYQGDAPVWLDYAAAIRSGAVFEWGLPLRPPGMAYFLSWIWNGSLNAVPALRFIWCLLGSVVPALYFAAALPFGVPAAWLTGTLIAISTSQIVLSNSLNVEIPYLILVGISLWMFPSLRDRPRAWWIALWSLLQGIACLLRAEHVLFFLLATGYLFVGNREAAGWRRSLVRNLLLVLFPFAIALAPWHLSAWKSIHRFNTTPQDLGTDIETWVRQVQEVRPPWDTDASSRLEQLPAFGRDFWAAVVSETVRHRGGTRVQPADLDILKQAFGYQPEPLNRFPFVTLYGPLNFYLANNDRATGGFSRDKLELPPPLSGGASNYPSSFATAFPPNTDLALWYPPHLQAINHGYSMGLKWIVSHPGQALKLWTRKLAMFWSGATMGFGGGNFPLGAGGVRRRVDVTTPAPGAGALAWHVALLLVAVIGLAAAWKRPGLFYWILLPVTYLGVTVLFFGYARLGAMVFPVIALLVSLGILHAITRILRLRAEVALRPVIIASLTVLALAGIFETVRYLHPPQIFVRGRPIGPVDPYPMRLYIDQPINVR